MRTYWSTYEVARSLGVTYRRLDNWCRRGWIAGQIEAPGSGAQRQWTAEDVARAREIRNAFDMAQKILEEAGLRNGPQSLGALARAS